MAHDDSRDNNLPSSDKSFEDALRVHIDGYDTYLRKTSNALRRDPDTDVVDEVFDKFKEVSGLMIITRPDITNNLMQSLQYYSEEMINTLRATYTRNGYKKAADIYTLWMQTVQGCDYDPDEISNVIDNNASWILDNAGAFDTYEHGVTALEATLIMHDRLLEKKAIDPKKVSGFVFHEAAPFIAHLPHVTESGLNEDRIDTTRTETTLGNTVFHTYSYAEKATTLYGWSLQLMRRTAPKKGVPAFVNKMQPDLSTTLCRKMCETTLTTHTLQNHDKQSVTWRGPDITSAMQTMNDTVLTLKETATPEQISAFIGATYHDVSTALIKDNQTDALAALYTLSHAALKTPDDRAEFASYYAVRHVRDMTENGTIEEVGVFLEQMRHKTKIHPQHLLFLTDKEKIVAANVPLRKGGKNRHATLLFTQDEVQALSSVIHDRDDDDNNEPVPISYSAAGRGLELKDRFADQIETMTRKILSHGLRTPHEPLNADDSPSSPWRVIAYRNI